MVEYQLDVPPVYEKNKPVKVQFGISLQQIQNVVCVHSEICKYWDFFFLLLITSTKICTHIDESLLD